MFARYFPQGIAEGEAFLGREPETARLQDNLNQGRHTLLLSPRRYGKTSLARHVITHFNYFYTEIDLFLAIDERSIEARFISGVEHLIQNISATPQQWLNILVNFFKKSDRKWTIEIKGLKLKLKPENHQDIPANLLLAFTALEHVLAKQKKRAVIFIDEFQEISKISSGKGIEGAVRHFAQSSKYIVFIFSGSNRTMLTDIFANRSRPLYSLCDWITLQRIDAALYQTYINKIAKKTWHTILDQEIIDEIINITERHPETIYTLCADLWQYWKQQNGKPKKENVLQVWKQYLRDRLKQTRLALSATSPGQMKILISIATGHNKRLTGKETQKKLNLTSPSIVNALSVLESQDFIEKCEDGSYHLIDPVIKDTLVEYYSEY